MALKLIVDVESIISQFKDFELSIKQDIKNAMAELAELTRVRIVEMAGEVLHTSRQTYMDALSDVEEITPGVWVISLDEKALWIEEGTEPRDMKPDLLKGRGYRIIPFRYDRPKSQNSSFTQGLIGEIKQKLKKEKIPFKKHLEYDQNGSPRLGKLHEFNLGGPRPGKGNTPALNRLTIYQNKDEKTGKVSREILTFRTVKKVGQERKWRHPGNKAKSLMDKAMDLAQKDWEEKILPDIIAKWSGD